LKIGIDTAYPGKDVWGSLRLLSKPGEASVKVGEQPAPKLVAAEEPTGDTPVKAATASAVASKPAGSVPRPAKRDVTEEEKAVFRARAKAWAIEKKKK
jgi:hypothetical protein